MGCRAYPSLMGRTVSLISFSIIEFSSVADLLDLLNIQILACKWFKHWLLWSGAQKLLWLTDTRQCVQPVFNIYLPVYWENISFTTLLTLYSLFQNSYHLYTVCQNYIFQGKYFSRKKLKSERNVHTFWRLD